MTWTTIDAYQLAPGKSAQPTAITIDTIGNIFVGGRAAGRRGDGPLDRAQAAGALIGL